MSRLAGEIEDLVRWAHGASCVPMSAELVPGADESERSALAAVGALVRVSVDKTNRRTWPDAVQAWCEYGPDVPATVRSALEHAMANERDALAYLYEQLVSGANRRSLGTFFTPPQVVRFMLDRVSACAGVPSTIVDPGAGVGAFSLAARRRWRKSSVDSIDLNVVTLGLLGLRCAYEGVQMVQLVHGDYLNWVAQTDDNSPGMRLLLGNPPYTRHQELDRKVREQLPQSAAALITSGLAGLSAYFLAASLVGLRPQDALCFVLPGSWTETRYGRELRNWLWRANHRAVELHAFPPALELFRGTKVTAMVLTVGPQRTTPQDLTIHQSQLQRGNVQTTRGARRSRRSEPPTSLGPLLWRRSTPETGATIPLSSIATVRRGNATGANHFFFLRDDELDGLPDAAIWPALRRMRHVEGDLLGLREHDRIGLAGHPRWLLWLEDPRVAKSAEVQRRLRKAEQAGVHQGYLVSHRHPWYVVEQMAPPDIFVALMSKARIRAVRNGIDAIPSNSMHGVYLRRKSLAREVCTWLNSDDGQIAMIAAARHYSGGLRKLEPSELGSVRVPAAFSPALVQDR